MFQICFCFYPVDLLCATSYCGIGVSCKLNLDADSVFYPNHFLFLVKFFLPLFFAFSIFEHPCHTMSLSPSLFFSWWSQEHVGVV